MSTSTDMAATVDSKSRLKHLLISSGGSRAILAGAGVILVTSHAGITKFKSIGGISGGSLPTAFVSSGMDARTSVATALDVDFASLLTRRGSLLKILFASMMQRYYESSRPRFGVLSSEKLGVYIEEKAKWNELYWTQSCEGETQIICTSTGVHLRKADGSYELLASEPMPLGAAIRGSCAVPGIIDAVPVDIAGKRYWLHDGVLGPEGRTPVSVPEKFFGAKPEDIIVCDVGDVEETSRRSRIVRSWWQRLCGKTCLPQHDPEPLSSKDGYIVIFPTVDQFGSLKFTLTRDEKWQGIMSGFVGGIEPLEKAGLLVGDKLVAARKIAEDFDKLVADCKKSKAKTGELSRLTEALLASHGLW